MGTLIKFIIFSILIVALTACNGTNENRLRQKIDVTSLKDSSSRLNKEYNTVITKHEENHQEHPFVNKSLSNTTVVFPDFEITFYNYEVRSPDFEEQGALNSLDRKTFDYQIENPGVYYAKRDTVFLTETPGTYLTYSKIGIKGRHRDESYKVSVALLHHVYQLYYGKIDNYDEWVKTSFQWDGETKYEGIEEKRKNIFSYYNVKTDSIYLNLKEKSKLLLRDTVVRMPQVVDTREEYFDVKLVRQDGRLCGYSIEGANIKIQRYTNKKLTGTYYISVGFEDEY